MRRNPDLSLDDRDSNLVEPLPGGTGRFAVTATTWLGCLRSLAFGDEIRSVRESMLRLLALCADVAA